MIFEAPPDARGNDRLLTVCVPSKGRRGASRRPSRCGGPEFPISSGPRRDTLMLRPRRPSEPGLSFKGLGPRCGCNGTARPKAAGLRFGGSPARGEWVPTV